MSERLDLHRDIVRLARIDFRTFVYRAALILLGEMLLPNWHIDVLIRAAEKVAEGSTRRLLACLPPRYLKTFIFSVCLPAWLLGRDPRSKIICASYSMPLAERFNLDVIRLMTSDWYRQVFPKTRLNKRRTNVTELTTTAGGFRLAASVGGTLTGRGADLLIIDDPIKADEAHSETARENCKTWFARSVSTRLNKPKSGAFVVVAQRLHAADLPGQLIEQGGWEQVIIPAIMPERRVFDVLKGGLKGYKDAGDILQPERQDEEMLQQQKLTMGGLIVATQNEALAFGQLVESVLNRLNRFLPGQAFIGVGLASLGSCRFLQQETQSQVHDHLGKGIVAFGDIGRSALAANRFHPVRLVSLVEGELLPKLASLCDTINDAARDALASIGLKGHLAVRFKAVDSLKQPGATPLHKIAMLDVAPRPIPKMPSRQSVCEG